MVCNYSAMPLVVPSCICPNFVCCPLFSCQLTALPEHDRNKIKCSEMDFVSVHLMNSQSSWAEMNSLMNWWLLRGMMAAERHSYLREQRVNSK